MSRVVAVVAAAGRGERLGSHSDERGKALVEIDGEPMVGLAVRGLRAAGVETVVVVHPPGEEEAFADVVGPAVRLVPGGSTRTDSVRAGFAATPEEFELVAVHDAARPLVGAAVVRRAIAAVRDDVVASAPGLPVADTLKRVENGTVVETIDRRGLWAVQTPQVIRRDVLAAALDPAQGAATDDLGLVERAIADGIVAGRVVVVASDRRGTKITGPEDLAFVRALREGEAVAPVGEHRS